jgi:acyl-CoA thioesterase-1
MIYGDSLSAGYGLPLEQSWATLLQRALPTSKWHIINASVSGETTSGGLARLPQQLQHHQPDILLIELGGNDGLRGLPPQQMKKNLAQMIQLAKAQQIKVILMQIRIPPNYGPRYTQLFDAVYPALAAEHGITLWPFFLDNIATQPELMQADGIHPNAKAQPLIVSWMKTQLATLPK